MVAKVLLDGVKLFVGGERAMGEVMEEIEVIFVEIPQLWGISIQLSLDNRSHDVMNKKKGKGWMSESLRG